ncbi:MAG: hypothetical protein AAGF33_03380 [Pseudomonadota bacterium]
MKRDRENTVGELTRFAKLGQIFARHSLKKLESALCNLAFSEEVRDARDLRPRIWGGAIGPVGIRLGQFLATRSALFTEHWITAFDTLHD